jgi:hypothetical protein
MWPPVVGTGTSATTPWCPTPGPATASARAGRSTSRTARCAPTASTCRWAGAAARTAPSARHTRCVACDGSFCVDWWLSTLLTSHVCRSRSRCPTSSFHVRAGPNRRGREGPVQVRLPVVRQQRLPGQPSARLRHVPVPVQPDVRRAPDRGPGVLPVPLPGRLRRAAGAGRQLQLCVPGRVVPQGAAAAGERWLRLRGLPGYASPLDCLR